jgi:hypothetical protein
MIARRVVFSMVLWAVVLVSGEGLVSADGFRCPTKDRLIETGDSIAKVLADCGAPKSRTDVTETACRKTGSCAKFKAGERWVYDFGSNYLVRYLLFRDDLLALIETGMYGGEH